MALCLAPMSLYSRYMMWVPDLESYLSHMPKFLILSGFLSLIYSMDTNFLSCLKQDLATNRIQWQRFPS